MQIELFEVDGIQNAFDSMKSGKPFSLFGIPHRIKEMSIMHDFNGPVGAILEIERDESAENLARFLANPNGPRHE